MNASLYQLPFRISTKIWSPHSFPNLSNPHPTISQEEETHWEMEGNHFHRTHLGGNIIPACWTWIKRLMNYTIQTGKVITGIGGGSNVRHISIVLFSEGKRRAHVIISIWKEKMKWFLLPGMVPFSIPVGRSRSGGGGPPLSHFCPFFNQKEKSFRCLPPSYPLPCPCTTHFLP